MGLARLHVGHLCLEVALSVSGPAGARLPHAGPPHQLSECICPSGVFWPQQNKPIPRCLTSPGLCRLLGTGASESRFHALTGVRLLLVPLCAPGKTDTVSSNQR